MDLEDIQEQINKLEGSEKEKQAILKLIKIKTDSDMDKVLNAISVLKSETNASIGSLKESILSNRTETNANIGALKSETSLIKWLIGGIATLILWSIFKK